ncbi:hypothetical protein IJ103_02585 [Candidatus Saccharibacteria bacterium]|nr:hypothetical protein [Candidatus Saccharibacteria bacterium]MBQ9017107.1 hypothetical protein [Candidatus Saccharibacteria bacterium]
MDQFGQTNNNDLQRAIDEISNGSDNNAAPVEENNIQINLGEPPVPPTNDFGMPPMDGATVNPPEPPVEPAPAPEPTPAPVSGDLDSVRETALKELVPIIDKAGLSADRQFGIITAVVESSHDKSFIPKAFEAARNIPDDKLRAEALLKIVGLIDQ